jgi:predicted nucleic acid-binding Zn ribbon protein
MTVCANHNCNKEFNKGNIRQIYCSKKCAQTMSTFFRTKRNTLKHINKKCLICGQVVISTKKYCSNECAKIAVKKQRKDWQQTHILESKENKKRWNNTHKDYLNNYEKNKKKSNINYKIRKVLGSRLTNVIKRCNGVKSASSLKLLGCSIEDARQYLESKFQQGMTWNNHGFGDDKWHIDHIIPCDAFDLTKPEEQTKCFHYTNLQPLWQYDNLSKSNKIGVKI